MHLLQLPHQADQAKELKQIDHNAHTAALQHAMGFVVALAAKDLVATIVAKGSAVVDVMHVVRCVAQEGAPLLSVVLLTTFRHR